MVNSTITVSLGTVKEKRKIKGTLQPNITDIVSVDVSCSLCTKAFMKGDVLHYEYKTGVVPVSHRFHPGYTTAEVKIFLVNKDGESQTVKLSAKITT